MIKVTLQKSLPLGFFQKQREGVTRGRSHSCLMETVQVCGLDLFLKRSQLFVVGILLAILREMI